VNTTDIANTALICFFGAKFISVAHFDTETSW